MAGMGRGIWASQVTTKIGFFGRELSLNLSESHAFPACQAYWAFPTQAMGFQTHLTVLWLSSVLEMPLLRAFSGHQPSFYHPSRSNLTVFLGETFPLHICLPPSHHLVQLNYVQVLVACLLSAQLNNSWWEITQSLPSPPHWLNHRKLWINICSRKDTITGGQ